MDSVTFHHDSVLSDVHIFQPRARHLMTRLNHAGQPVFLSKFQILSQNETNDCSKEKHDKEEGKDEENTELVLDDDGDFNIAHRPRTYPENSGRDVLCPILLHQANPQDPPREDNPTESKDIIRIEHTMATLLEDVGKQVWRGSFLLADFILSEAAEFKGSTVLELGAGTGLASIVTACSAKRVYCTDVGEDLLNMCRRNVTLNKHLIESAGGEVRVRQLDWLQQDICTDADVEFSWTEEEVADLYDHTSAIIAADVCYDDDLTDAFFRTLYHLCSSFNHSCKIYISIEKRMNFTLRQMDVCCEAYEHFRHCVLQLQDLDHAPCIFRVEQISPNFSQSLMYDRVEQLELWKVTATFSQATE